MLTQAAREAVSMSKLINFSSFLRCLLGDENYRLFLVFFYPGYSSLVMVSLWPAALSTSHSGCLVPERMSWAGSSLGW